MEGIRKQAQVVPVDLDISDAIPPIGDKRSSVTFRRNPGAEAAVQYLTWALEEIEKIGNQKSARDARAALAALRKGIQQKAR